MGILCLRQQYYAFGLSVRPSVNAYFAWRDISVFVRAISVKLDSSCQWASLERFSRLRGQRSRSRSNCRENCVNSPARERLKGRVATLTQTAVGRWDEVFFFNVARSDMLSQFSWCLRKFLSDIHENFTIDEFLDKEHPVKLWKLFGFWVRI